MVGEDDEGEAQDPYRRTHSPRPSSRLFGKELFEIKGKNEGKCDLGAAIDSGSNEPAEIRNDHSGVSAVDYRPS